MKFSSAQFGIRRRYRIAELAALVAIAAVTGIGCAGALDQSAAGEVKTGIQQVRQLNFIEDVPFVVKSPADAQQMMVEKLSRDNSDEELRIGGEAGAMTGLFRDGVDLKTEELNLMREQVAGFYDPHDKVMVEVRGMSVLGTSLAGRAQFGNELLQAHELTHALQDQHFTLDHLLATVKNNDDEELALHSLIEGDATLAGLGYVSGGMTEETEEKIVKHFGALPESFEPESSGVPLALSAPLMFQYAQGTRFVAEAWKRGGWTAVDALYRDPPVSTQQILNPALYFDHRTTPLLIMINGYRELLPEWKKVDDDTFGELLLRVIFQRNLPSNSPALQLPDKWRGDHMIALQRDHKLMLIWVIGFDDSQSAQSFAGYYSPILDRLNRSSRNHRLDVRSSNVLVMIGPADVPYAELTPSIWRASTITPAHSAQPELAQPPAIKIDVGEQLKPACTVPTTCPPPADKSWGR